MSAVETDVATIELDVDGVIVMRLKAGAVMDRESTRPVRDAHLELAAGRRLPMIADIRAVGSVNRQSREIAAGPEVSAVVSRLAILIGNPVTRVIGSFFLQVRGPDYPVRIFGDEKTARRWLLDG